MLAPGLVIDEGEVNIAANRQMSLGCLGHPLQIPLAECEHWARVERQQSLVLKKVKFMM